MSNEITLNQNLTVLIIIVNYKTPQLTIDCLHSLAAQKDDVPQTNVIVVDNDSKDDSVELINQVIATENWTDWVDLLASNHNGGYAYGNNLAIRLALQLTNPPDFFWLLNPDTILRPKALKILVDFLNQHPEVGIVGSRLEELDGTPQISAFRFHTIWSELDSGLRLGIVSKILTQKIVAPPVVDVACQTDWLAGASLLIRRQLFEKIGLMDEEYFMYFEELDFCLQAKKAGWSCWYVPESRVVHLVGQSSGISKNIIKRRPQYWFDSRHRFFIKNYGWFYAVLADIFWLFGFSLWRIRRIIQNKPDTDPPNFLTDFFRNSLLIKGNINNIK